MGDSKPRKIDVRIIAATHRDLNEEVREGRFRADLLYRIRVARISLPALRERPLDIPLLAAHFLRQFRSTTGKDVQHISHDAMRLMSIYAWPGNVRELASAIEFGAIQCRRPVIQESDLPPEIHQSQTAATVPAETAPAEIAPGLTEKERILEALKRVRGNRSKAARLLEISRATLYRRLSELGIQS